MAHRTRALPFPHRLDRRRGGGEDREPATTEGFPMGRAEELAEIDALFARADQDNDGQINFTEFKALVRELDEDLTEQELRIGFTDTDANGNGRINIDEFRAWWLSA
jgi:Ca2+-binding EF-hand superfamily protein